MGYAVGIDLGSTTAKFTAKGVRGLASQSRPAIRQEALVGRGLEEFLAWAGIGREEVERVVLTGVRTAAFTHSVLGLPTCTVPEFEAIGRGGLALSDGLEEALVVSLGTGTASSALIWAANTNANPFSTANCTPPVLDPNM